MARGDLNASQAGRNERGSALTDRDVETLITRVLVSKYGLSERVVQRLQELAGERNVPGDFTRPGAAVRRDDLGALKRVLAMKSAPAAAAPTQAEYNKLRDDVRQLYDLLGTVVLALNAAFDG